MSNVEIKLGQPGTRAQILIDGQDVAASTRGFRFKADVGYMPELELNLAIIDASEIQAEKVKLVMDDATAALLIRADWTPPGDAITELRAHSVTLNTICWKIATALGEVPDGAGQITGNPEAQTDQLIGELAGVRDHHNLLAGAFDRFQAELAEAKLQLEGWEQVGQTISHLIPEHYEASEGALMGIIADWAKDADGVVSAAHLWRQDRTPESESKLAAAVETVLPKGMYA